ncbi:MAG: RecQ family ATP-dependent DNA helicase [Melioribacter sp.]|uniref:RecQ family ATP-dependent DNA helicase n=1 Tax=Melioribacter sp. TaxID=2052167 RepID=UPI003BC1EB7D
MKPEKILKEFFGYENFRPGQKEIIDSILEGRNTLAIMPTGGGKSICYQIPALLSDSLSIVISPLISLMKDQVDSINQKEEVAAYINSSIDPKEIYSTYRNIDSGKIKLLYVAPEKLDNKDFTEKIRSVKPAFLFVDEAHCISEWGHNFRPSYRKIKEFGEYVGIAKISAFTATATEDVREDIVAQLGMKNPRVFVYGFERSNLHLNVIRTLRKKETLLKILNENGKPAIVYTATRRYTEELAKFLTDNGVVSSYYHAGLTTEMRKIIQDDFISGRTQTIIATNAFGMGIDKSDIRTIVHYNIPGNLENYYQEIGRAGRDGKPSNIFLLYDEQDVNIQEYFINNSFPNRSQVELVYNSICDHHKIALNTFPDKPARLEPALIAYLEKQKINKALLESSLKILEKSGYMKPDKSNSSKYYVAIPHTYEKIDSFAKKLEDNELKDLLYLLAKLYKEKIFVRKTEISIKKLSEIIGATEKEIAENLELLDRSGIINFTKPTLHVEIKFIKERLRNDLLKFDFSDNERLIKHHRTKLQRMIDYAHTNDCRMKFILYYFGEKNDNYECGKCDNCTNVKIALSDNDYIKGHILSVLREYNNPLHTQTLTKILTGADPNYGNYASYASCAHFAAWEIEDSITDLQNENKIECKNGLVKLKVAIKRNDFNDYESRLILLNKLKEIRKEASQKFNQPAYMICPDDVLIEIARRKPSSYSELMSIRGFTKYMYNKLGEEILSVIKTAEEESSLDKKLSEKNLPQNFRKIYELVQKRYSLRDMSSITGLPESVISIQLETLIGILPELETDYLFDKGELELINEKINEGIRDIKNLYKIFEGKISYSKLRIALARKGFS